MSLIPSGELKVKVLFGANPTLYVSMSLIPSGELKVYKLAIWRRKRRQVSMSLIPSGELKEGTLNPADKMKVAVSMSLIPSGELKAHYAPAEPLYQIVGINESNSLRGVERRTVSPSLIVRLCINESNSLRGVESFKCPPLPASVVPYQ